MKNENKIIRDSIHGNIKINGLFVDLLSSPEIQRLSNIKQLGLAHLVFPGAHHTRLEHSIGVFHMASLITDALNLEEEDKILIKCAGLLHDIGHGPFSHTLESILRESLNVDHVGLTQKLILGEYDIFQENEKNLFNISSNVSEILDKHKLDKNQIISIIKGDYEKKPFCAELLNGVIDVDQLDYLLRDAYYTGVSYGMIDSQRFLQTLMINDNHIAVNRKGVGVVENVLMARALMYSSVYFHKTVRIAELMLSKSIEMINDIKPYDFYKLTDAELTNNLMQKNQFQKEIITRLKYRQLFKQAFILSPNQRNNQITELIKKLENPIFRRKKEQEFEETLNIPTGHVIIDAPLQDLYQAEPRIQEIEIPVIDDNQIKDLKEFTPVAEAIKMRSIPDWDIMIITDNQYRNTIFDNANEILFQ
jgi:HD superfamily phosphohydrolase